MRARRLHRVARVLLTGLIVLSAAVVTRAEALVYEHDGSPLFSIEVPDGWLIDLDFAQEAREAGTYVEGEELQIRVVEIRPDDGRKIWFGIWSVPKATNLEEAADYLRSLRGDLFTDPDLSAPSDAELGGMAGRKMTGTATYEGEEVEVALALFQARSDVVVAAIYVGAPDAWSIHEDELTAMLRSVRPAK